MAPMRIERAWSLLVATASFVTISTLALVEVLREEPGLAAASNHGRYDFDDDGLTDLQEEVIGTFPYRADTDNDGYSDLEERARGTDPLLATSVPEACEFSVGSCASQENGFVSAVAALYLDSTAMHETVLQLGIIYRGRAYPLSLNSAFTRAYLFPGHDAADTLAVVEVGLPESLIQRLGQVSVFSVLRGVGQNPVDPMASILTIRDLQGIAVSVEQVTPHASNNGGGATGVVYQPLTGDASIPSDWTPGEMCFLRTSAIGTSGVSITHEVDGAFCIPMDTYCSPTQCASALGTSLQLPDPAALTGG